MSTDLKRLREDRVWAVTITLVVLGLLWFLRPFLPVIALAALFAYLFNPLYLKWLKKWKKKGLALTAITLFSMLIIGIPVLVIVIYAVAQGLNLLDNLELGQLVIDGENTYPQIIAFVDDFNAWVEGFVGIDEIVSPSEVGEFLRVTIPKVLQGMLNLLLGIISGIPNFFTNLILYLFAFIGLLAGQDKLGENIRTISPFKKEETELYLKRIGLMAGAMVKGQLLIAFLQGLAGAASLALVGLGDFFFIFLLIFTLLNFIPLGSGLITIPAGLLALVLGNFSAGLIILLTHFIVVTNIDNIVRPMVVPNDARLPASLTIISAFAGVAYFGFLGVVYGPIIMIFIMTTFEMYEKHKKGRIKATG